MTFANAVYGVMTNLVGGWAAGYGDDSDYYSGDSDLEGDYEDD